MARKSWDEYFLEIAEVVSTRATCIRLQVGCVIVKDKNIVSTGYNGSIHGHPHCTDEGVGCLLNDQGRCIRTIHAEENAVLHAERHLLNDSTVYVTDEPCEKCSKTLAQAGVKRIVFRRPYANKWNVHFLEGIEVVHLPVDWIQVWFESRYFMDIYKDLVDSLFELKESFTKEQLKVKIEERNIEVKDVDLLFDLLLEKGIIISLEDDTFKVSIEKAFNDFYEKNK